VKTSSSDSNRFSPRGPPSPSYWNDFVFEGYVNYRTDAIYLRGLPDIPESRPHSEVSS
jgi:hypothetical protein